MLGTRTSPSATACGSTLRGFKGSNLQIQFALRAQCGRGRLMHTQQCGLFQIPKTFWAKPNDAYTWFLSHTLASCYGLPVSELKNMIRPFRGVHPQIHES